MPADIWDAYWSDENDRDWWMRPAPEVLELIDSQSPANRPDVLDLGCGLGRHAIAFAQAGFNVTAIDASETAIAHLRERTEELGLEIDARTQDLFDASLPTGSFDIVLSYNVIYHGHRELFFQAIEHVRALLRPAGLFFFTCPTRQDGKYGFGQQVAPHTFRCEKSITPGDIHYFADQEDLDQLDGFGQLSRRKDEGYWNNRGARQFYSNWQVLLERL
jgi:2-polyprenyl-3-methyl-5-hydroxy-6-metoxy-1,4-benzoquinol methylase